MFASTRTRRVAGSPSAAPFSCLLAMVAAALVSPSALAPAAAAQSKEQPEQDRAKGDANKLQELVGRAESIRKELELLRSPSSSENTSKPAEATLKNENDPSRESAKGETIDGGESRKAAAQPAAIGSNSPTFQPAWLETLSWRCIGPAAMGGRIVQIAPVESDLCCYYVATASGGLFKTVNHGTTFVPVFDHQNSISIGDVAVSPSNPQVVWVGTGENNARNSVSWGDGVYKSIDGGANWHHMGLKHSYQIGRIVVHPRNPDIVYVGALGRLWGENEDRGVYKTVDGGLTWERVLYVDSKTGCIDLVLNPDEPETLIAAMYERQRGIYDDGDPIKRWGAGSGLYRSVNGGKDWTRLSQGLPTVAMGRIGLSVLKKNPKVVYAIIETEKIGTGPRSQESTGAPAYMGMQGEGEEGGARLTVITSGGPAETSGLKEGDVVVELAGKAVTSYADLTNQIQSHKAGEKVRLKVQRDNAIIEIELTFGERPAGESGAGRGGGRTGTAGNPFSGGLGGQRENQQDHQGEDGFQTGGVFRSSDGGKRWERINSLNPRPFYFSRIQVDPNDENYVYVLGISGYKSSDGGKKFSADLARAVHSDHHAIWIDPRDGRHMLLGGDGGLYSSHDRGATWEHVNIMPLGQFYHVAVDTRRPYRVYGGLQDNGSWGGPSMTRGRGPANEDWLTVGGGDGFTCQVDSNDPDLVYYTSQYGNMGRINVQTGERRPIRPRAEQGQRFRFNWKTPFVLSNHNSRIFYAAGNYVFKSLDRGDRLRIISPQLPATERGTASALAESPLNPDVLYVGTDDGALWVTRNGGHDWANVNAAIKDVPAKACIASIEPSRFSEARCYVAIDAHRADSTAPFLLVTEDYGSTWRPLQNSLPDGSTRTVREDIHNENLLYVGTEFGIWTSIDRGSSWIRLNNNLPTVAVHELAQPRTANELVAATHGRSIWIVDVTPLRQLTQEVTAATAHLFRPAPAISWNNALNRTLFGHKRYTGENPTAGAAIHYLLSTPATEVKLTVIDSDGKLVRELRAETSPGLHRAVWDLRRLASGQSGGAAATRSTARSSSSQRGTGNNSPQATPGQYRVVLSVDGRELSQSIQVEPDPQFIASSFIASEDEPVDW